MAPSATRSAVLFALALTAGACAARSSTSAAGDALVTERATPLPNTCGGCQPSMANTCLRILGAAVDRPGVTVARLCDPWCCQLTNSELGDVGYVHALPAAPWSTCPELADASDEHLGVGRLEGSVVEGPTQLASRATVVLTGANQTVAETTSDVGRFHIDDLAAGDYTVTVYYGDVVFKQQCIRVAPEQTTALHVNLDVQVRTDAFFIVE